MPRIPFLSMASPSPTSRARYSPIRFPPIRLSHLEVISGAPPAEYGGKTSLVIKVTTRSGQGVTTPHGSVTTSYGTFGTSNLGFDLAYGGQKWGNFIAVSGLNTGRFLDPPEFDVIHDKGNEENIFDRVDYQAHQRRLAPAQPGLHPLLVSDAQCVRSTDATTSGDRQDGSDPTATRLAPTDQRSQIQHLQYRAHLDPPAEFNTRYLPWAHSSGAISTTTIPVTTLSPTWARPTCSARPWGRIAP